MSHSPMSYEEYSEVVQASLRNSGFWYERDCLGKSNFQNQNVYGYGAFACSRPRCNNQWTSRRAWLTVDLKNWEITYIFRQKCQNCNTKAEATFSDSELERMIAIVVDRFTGLVNGTYESGPRRTSNGPHDSSRCEKCGFGRGRPCIQSSHYEEDEDNEE